MTEAEAEAEAVAEAEAEVEAEAATVTVNAWDHPAEDPQLVIMEWILSRDWPSSVTSVRVSVTWPGIRIENCDH